MHVNFISSDQDMWLFMWTEGGAGFRNKIWLRHQRPYGVFGGHGYTRFIFFRKSSMIGI